MNVHTGQPAYDPSVYVNAAGVVGVSYFQWSSTASGNEPTNLVIRHSSQDTQPAEFGLGLECVLRSRSGTVTGILNGVDYKEWSPQTDKFIAAHYSPEDLSGKAACKKDLLTEFGITGADTALPPGF